MLEASQWERGEDWTNEYRPLRLEDLGTLMDRFAAGPPLSSDGGEVSGDHAWIGIIDRGFILHAYFGEQTRAEGVIGFELYGPYPPGKEREHGNPHDGSGLAGTMTVDCLKAVLSLLDQGRSPIDHVRAEAIEVAMVED